jgi:uncharacterized membrane protein
MPEQKEHLEQNLDSVLEVQKRDWEQRTPAQRRVETVSRIIGRPSYLVGLGVFVVLWVAANQIMPALGYKEFDPFPYFLLDSLLTLAALVSTTIILIAQTRLSRLEQQHTHIALQVNLLTEQKVAKLIAMLEELRRDMPMVRDRNDPQAEALSQRVDAAEIHAAIEEVGLTQEDEPPRVKPKPG